MPSTISLTTNQKKAALNLLARTVLRNDYIPHRPTQKQAQALGLAAVREILYGGAAGGGKSDWLLMAALQFVQFPGYAALILRRSYKDLSLPGALMDRAHQWLDATQAKWNDSTKTWTFPSGATLTFGYLERDQHVYQYQGSELQFCVGTGTEVLMADGSYRRVETLREGEMVETLQGPRPLTRPPKPRIADSYALETNGVTTIVSADHAILTENGWAAPAEPQPSRSNEGGSTSAESTWRRPRSERQPEYPQQDRPPAAEPRQRKAQESPHRAIGASTAGDQTGCVTSEDGPRATRPPRLWTGRAVLHERAARQAECGTAPAYQGREDGRAVDGRQPADSPSGYPSAGDSGDGLARHDATAAPDNTQQPTDAEAPRPPGYKRDDPKRIHGRSRSERHRYFHPYTKEPMESSAPVRMGAEVAMAPVGEREVWSLAVADVSHYVTRGGIVHRNCGFDELTQFSEFQYRYLASRLRRLTGTPVPLRQYSASNPGGRGHEWVKGRFVTSKAPNRVFIPARLQDNPHLDQEEYLESLDYLDPVTKQQLLAGDWDLIDTGEFFKRSWFTPIEEDRLPEMIRIVRFWDLASTKAPTRQYRDPDWTVGTKMGLGMDKRNYILGVDRFRGSPEEVLNRVAWNAANDGIETEVFIEREPGSSGVFTARQFAERLAAYPFKAIPARKSKVDQARPFSAAAERGEISYRIGAVDDDWFNELEMFPDPRVHDDRVDSASGAYARLHPPMERDRDERRSVSQQTW